MSDDATAPDAWQELRAFADALDDELIVLPPGLEADEPGAPGTASALDAWDELRAIGGTDAPEPSGPRRQR